MCVYIYIYIYIICICICIYISIYIHTNIYTAQQIIEHSIAYTCSARERSSMSASTRVRPHALEGLKAACTRLCARARASAAPLDTRPTRATAVEASSIEQPQSM